MTACMMLAQDSRYVHNSFHGKEVAAPLHRRTCTSAYAFFAEGMHTFLTGVVNTMYLQVCMLDRCWENRTHVLTRSLQDVHTRSCMHSLFI